MNLRGKLFLDNNSRFYLIKKDLYIYEIWFTVWTFFPGTFSVFSTAEKPDPSLASPDQLCDCGHNTGGSLRDDTERRNPY